LPPVKQGDQDAELDDAKERNRRDIACGEADAPRSYAGNWVTP